MKLFEAFPTLEFNEDITDILADVEVIKVTTNSAKTRLRVYILSKRLIPKQIIFELEAAFVRQLPPFRTMDVHVVEKYELSGQYNQEKLWGLYRESILEELKRESIFDYDLLKKAKVRFTAGDRMELTVPDGSIARDRIQGLREYLHMVFFDRCGFEIGFDVIYKEVKHEAKDTPVVYIEGKSSEENDEAVQKADIQKTDAQSAAAAAEDMQDSKYSVKEAAKDKKEDENKKFRSVKQSDNPDVIYGRDFDDEATELGTITHEIGESAVRGKIRGVEIKELKSGKNLLTFGITDFTDSISIKIFLNTKENVDEIKDSIVDGAFVKVKGVIAMDAWSKELAVSSVRGIKKIPDFTVKRKDNAEVKRVELHCHTKMSDMD
ncbi:MAG: PolC-type DNA polymerase III N-terminal domain-containing protein, partial [Lachnospiraceae bacterium]